MDAKNVAKKVGKTSLKVIKGVAKTTGKLTCKSLGKGVELAVRGSVNTVDKLVKSPTLQNLATSAGMLAASVMVPTVGVSLISVMAMKYMGDNVILGRNKGILDEVGDLIKMGNVVTKSVSNGILSPILQEIDRGIKNEGKSFQKKMNEVFR